MAGPTASSTTSSPAAPSPSGDRAPAAPAAADDHLDLAGEVCPYTFVRTRLALEALPLGARLAIEIDHEPARASVPRSAREWGQEVEAVEQVAPGRWRIVLIKRVT
ncbi:MAG: sulfurtransferase TusA family protein [Kofleriaceae bacterium]|nr:sulfurtransferase TusA family protein [Kofleriaceae bacterium]